MVPSSVGPLSSTEVLHFPSLVLVPGISFCLVFPPLSSSQMHWTTPTGGHGLSPPLP